MTDDRTVRGAWGGFLRELVAYLCEHVGWALARATLRLFALAQRLSPLTPDDVPRIAETFRDALRREGL